MNLVRSLMMIVSHLMRASRKSSSPSASKCSPGVCVCVCYEGAMERCAAQLRRVKERRELRKGV